MRRYNSPYNGTRFVLNKSTGEIHDLDNEKTLCSIDKINLNNVVNCDDYLTALIYAGVHNVKNPNGCHYCNPSKDNG